MIGTEEKYINPFTDFGFKKLFGEEPNKDLLIDFLNQLLPINSQVHKLFYLKNEHLGSIDTDRRAIFDLYCENEKGEKFIVELQKAKQDIFKDRSVFYSTFPIREQAKKGDWNFELKAVYTIGILDFVFEEDKYEEDKYFYQIKLTDVETYKVFYDKLTYIYLEMPKFKKTEGELGSKFDKWLYVLKHLPRLQGLPQGFQEKVFEKLFEVAEIAKYDMETRLAYEHSLKYYRDIKNSIDTAYLSGGKDKAVQIALAMLQEGESFERIQLYTSLSFDEINKLKNG